MTTSPNSIGPMDKVTLHIQAVSRQETHALKSIETDVSFICGIGTAGLMPFERMLFEKSEGETFTIPIEIGMGDALFGHLLCTLNQAIGMTPPYDLHIAIASVTVAEGREVVKAMAQMAGGCSGGCDCGCGC